MEKFNSFKIKIIVNRFDVAVLQLSSAVSYMSHIAPICLPQVGRDPEVILVSYHVHNSVIIFKYFSLAQLLMLLGGVP